MTLFDGATFDDDRDGDRLRAQFRRVWGVMADEAWHTLPEMSAATGDPPASISARIRDFRKDKFGGHTVLREHVVKGLWKYKLLARKAVTA